MKYLIVTPFFNHDADISRPGFVKQSLEDVGIKVDVLTSDFSHLKKIKEYNNEYKLLKTIPYSKNVSILRFISHFKLSIDMFLYIMREHENYDRIYITAPFALTVLLSGFFIKSKIIVDIIDYWPLSLPFPKYKVLSPILKVWELVNRYALTRADIVMSPSTSFLRDARCSLDGYIPLCGMYYDMNFDNISINEVHILYVGNIGELYDFDTLIRAISNCNKLNITFHLVGDGDKKNNLIDMLNSYGVKYFYYGIVHDKNTLRNIIKKCDYGFNGFKNTNASLSYKSITYMQHQLPVINSMEGDLWSYVKDYSIGFNYKAGNVLELEKILNSIADKSNVDLKMNLQNFFLKHLDTRVVKKNILKKLGVLNEKII